MPFKEMIAVNSENHVNPINTLCEHSAQLLDVKLDASHSYHLALNG
jgi:hypothetical protein